jgi:glucan 1,3-beta-glucosidase
MTDDQLQDIREADWVGRYNKTSKTYPGGLNLGNIVHSLHVIEAIAVRYQNDLTVVGIEPVNEPWEFTPIELLKQFYWYDRCKAYMPLLLAFGSNSFLFET